MKYLPTPSIPIVALVLLASCATVSQPTVINAGAAQSSSITLAQSGEPKLKHKVAIQRFSNETNYGRGVFGGREGSPIEKQAQDLLAARLVESGLVILIDNPMGGQTKTGADYAIIGSVSAFGRKNSSDTGVFSRTKTQVAYASVNLRLIEVASGRVIYAEEGSGEAEVESGRVMGVGSDAGYDSTLNDKAISAAISKMISNMLSNLLSEPWRTGIMEVNGDELLIAGGSAQGLKVGMMLSVIKKGRVVKNPQYGTSVELPGIEVAKMEVMSFFGKGITQEGSICHLTSGSLDEISLSDLRVEEIK
jgi:curli biogenesis system outer membrane secretion channel CsgG